MYDDPSTPPGSQVKRIFKNGLRVLLTGNCNYRCFFCHNEGLDRDGAEEAESISADVLIGFISCGVRDITFSGGEPLLCIDKLEELLEAMNRELPEDIRRILTLTLVTNGSLLSSDILDRLDVYRERFGGFKINLSLHTLDQVEYDLITGTRGQMDRVLEGIRHARERGFDVRLNFVLLRHHNVSGDKVDQLMDFTRSLGVRRMKLIEFLVTGMNRGHYKDLFRLNHIIYNNRHRAVVVRKPTLRKTTHVYEYGDSDLTVDYIWHTCSLGCRNCYQTRELELVPGNRLMGCITMEPIVFDYPEESPYEAASRAVGQIDEMVKRFGDRSPSIASRMEIVAARAVFNVAVPERVSELLEQVLIGDYREYVRTEFTHQAPGTYDNPWKFVLIESQEETHSDILCFTEERKDSDGLVWQELRYLDPVYRFSRTRAHVNRKKLDAMGFIPMDPEFVIDESAVLSEQDGTEPAVILRRLTHPDTGHRRFILEVIRPEDDEWAENEPLRRARSLSAEMGLELTPITAAT